MKDIADGIKDAAKRIFQYLCVNEAAAKADLIIGFGHFDLRIPELCGGLYQSGRAGRILLTGGRGSGTADLTDAEAAVFAGVLREKYPFIPKAHVFVESESTNTGENIRFSARVLSATDNAFCFERGIKSVIAVASPYRQRRVWRTMQKLYPGIRVFNRPPETSFEEEIRVFQAKNQDLVSLLAGELERIMTYPEKGYMAAEIIPPDIMEAYRQIKNSKDCLKNM